MKIIFIKKHYFLYLALFLSILLYIILFFISNPFTFAVELKRLSLANINISNTLDDITKSNEKKAYLTFDDGPTSKATGKILDILKEMNVKATFFVVGKHVKEHPELVKRAYDEGHYIANHGYSHNNKLLYKNMESFKNEVVSTDLEISKAIGVDICPIYTLNKKKKHFQSYLA